MGRVFQVYQHRQLCARNGDLVAGGGETVPADHPAVVALTDSASVGRFIDAPVLPTMPVSASPSSSARPDLRPSPTIRGSDDET